MILTKSYVERELVVDIIEKMKPNFAPLHRRVLDSAIHCIKMYVPEADAQPIIYATWIPASNKPNVFAGMKCSNCKARISYSEYYNGNHNYCYKCGAKMRVALS